MALYINFEDLTEDATRRLLKEVVMRDSVRQMPLHKRKKTLARESAEDEEDERAEEDEDEKDADRDREERANLVETYRPGNAPEMTAEDFAENSLPKRLTNPPKVSKAGKAGKRKK